MFLCISVCFGDYLNIVSPIKLKNSISYYNAYRHEINFVTERETLKVTSPSKIRSVQPIIDVPILFRYLLTGLI